jgi:hypothetical protein
MKRSLLSMVIAVAPLLFIGAGCSSEPAADVAATSQEVSSAGKPLILVPTTAAALTACADELAATYCSRADAEKAKATCERALPSDAKTDCDAERGCTFAFPTERTGACHQGPTYASKVACATPQVDDCSFYASCMETTLACGSDGYARSFGQPLCYKFLEHRQDFSPHAQRWLKRVRACLQEQMVPLLARSGQTCASLENAAYASHVTCYTDPADSICQVGLGDLLVLFGIIHDELFSAQGFQQVKGVAQACLTQVFQGHPRAGAAHAAQASDLRPEALFLELANAEDDAALSRALDTARTRTRTLSP